MVAPDAATTVVSSGTPATLFATATDGNGCVGYDTLDIQVLALPSLAVTDTLSACDQPIVEQLPDMRAEQPLPIREVQTLCMELLLGKALERGLELAVLGNPAYQRYAAARQPR